MKIFIEEKLFENYNNLWLFNFCVFCVYILIINKYLYKL